MCSHFFSQDDQHGASTHDRSPKIDEWEVMMAATGTVMLFVSLPIMTRLKSDSSINNVYGYDNDEYDGNNEKRKKTKVNE